MGHKIHLDRRLHACTYAQYILPTRFSYTFPIHDKHILKRKEHQRTPQETSELPCLMRLDQQESKHPFKGVSEHRVHQNPKVFPSNLPCGGWIHHFRELYHIVGTKIYHYNIPTIPTNFAFIVILPHKITSGHLPWEILRDIPIISPFPRQILRKLLRVRVLVKAR